MEVRRTFCEACASRVRPTAVEPVNDTFLRRSSAISAETTSPVREVVTTFSTPSGRPASRIRDAKYRELSGVREAGLSTAVQPAASAGATLRAAMASGKFQGVMSRQGPTGRRTVVICSPDSGATAVRPKLRAASSAYQRR